MIIIRRLTTLFLLAAVLSVPAATQERPNFGGIWTLESSTPENVLNLRPTHVVKHQGTTLTYGNPGGGHHSYDYTIDGQEHEGKIGPSTVRSRATWEGDTLVLERTDVLPSGVTRRTNQRWSLNAGKLRIVYTDAVNGKTVTVTNVYIKK